MLLVLCSSSSLAPCINKHELGLGSMDVVTLVKLLIVSQSINEKKVLLGAANDCALPKSFLLLSTNQGIRLSLSFRINGYFHIIEKVATNHHESTGKGDSS